MADLLKLVFFIVFCCLRINSFGQQIGKYLIFINLTETSLRNPQIGFEIFQNSKRTSSFSLELSYKIQDKKHGSFLMTSLNAKSSTLAPNLGKPIDVFSMFVYNGPTLKISKGKYANLFRKNSYKYWTIGILLKYNWYKNHKVEYNDIRSNQNEQYIFHSRIQNEKMGSFGSDFELGILKKRKMISYKFYVGGVISYRHRNKIYSSETYSYFPGNSAAVHFSNSDFKKEYSNTIDFYPNFGIKVGLLR